MKRCVWSICLVVGLSVTFAGTAMAGTWRTGTGSDSGKWWYDNGNGSWPAECWQWIDGDSDNMAECYYFDMNGWLLTNGVTPDGSQVDGSGAWVQNGRVQQRNLLTSGSGGATGTIDVTSAGYAGGLSNVVNDMLNRSRAGNAELYGEATVKKMETSIEVTYSKIPFVAIYNNDGGQPNYSGNASGNPTRVTAGAGDAYLIFRERPEGYSISAATEYLKGRGYSVKAEKSGYNVMVGNCTIYISGTDDSAYAYIQ